MIKLLTLIFIYSTVNLMAQSEYMETPLRDSLHPYPHFNTALGREAHRFSEHLNNRYRLYDFYSRQAEYHLKSGVVPKKILPYPGLDGGRRGHWGFTNDPASTALKRKKLPKFGLITGRALGKEDGIQCLKYDEGIIVFDFKTNSLRSVYPDGRLTSLSHPFSEKVDRWGFDFSVKGKKILKGHKNEWRVNGLMPRYQGYYINDNTVIYKSVSQNVEFLQSFELRKGQMVRHFEFVNPAQKISVLLPLPGLEFSISLRSENKLILKTDQGYFVYQSSVPGVFESSVPGVFEEKNKNDLLFKMTEISQGQFGCLSVSYLKSMNELADVVAPVKLSPLTEGGPRRFPETILTAGKRNADPSASGTAYEIDDIAIPFDNPYNTPMTLSGVTFDEEGNAYVSTMVGDVWHVSGLDRDLQNIQWKRYATGLHLPLGLTMVNGKLYVCCKDQIAVLHDLNNDQEADFYERFNQVDIKLIPDKRMGLEVDAEGNFYYSSRAGIYRLSNDGKTEVQISGPSRNPLGMGVLPNGIILSDSSEGNLGNGTCSIFESDHSENFKTAGKRKRILYLPRGVDNSPGSRIPVNDFSDEKNVMFGVSYGAGTSYIILRDENNGDPQAALQPLPGEFASGSCRVRQNMKDRHIYTVGLDGWGDYAVEEGSFNRLRYVEDQALLPISWRAHKNGILIHFAKEIEPIHSKDFFAQQWNYTDSPNTYGSGEYSVKRPGELGHDYLHLSRAELVEDGKSIFFEMPDIQPAMVTHIFGHIKSKSGIQLKLNFFATINKLRNDYQGFIQTQTKTSVLAVPVKDKNGNTYQKLSGFFDKVTGRAGFKRPEVKGVDYHDAELNFAWINKHIIQKQCIMCHAKGTQHDYSTYEGLLSKINLKEPEKSHLFGMLQTQSMPPFPLPTVSKDMQEALLKWIEKGAPK